MITAAMYNQYLEALRRPFKKISKLEFLQPDDTVAFAIDSNSIKKMVGKYDTRAFLQSGSLNVSFQNGTRRTATINLSNLDDNFSYNVNKVWFGQKVRLSMGLVLPSGESFYLPQGIFYIKNPKAKFSPTERSVSYNLVDKWAYLDGSLFGKLRDSYSVLQDNSENTLFGAIRTLLRYSKRNMNAETADKLDMVDSIDPIFTQYYNGKTYQLSDGSYVPMTSIPFDVVIGADNASIANIILELAEIVSGIVGYDRTGTFRFDATQTDVEDSSKPSLWSFDPTNSVLLSFEETMKNADVYNNVLIVGEGAADKYIYGEASNYDPSSDTNINLIGKRTFKESKANYWTQTQCDDLAAYYLKRKTILQKSITISCNQMFHLEENGIVSIVRTDKPNSPVERHLIQSFSLPIGETGQMSINATSVFDIPKLNITMN